MIRKIFRKSHFSIPVFRDAPLQQVRLSGGGDSMLLHIPAVTGSGSPYDFIARYTLPDGWEETAIEAEPEFFLRLQPEDGPGDFLPQEDAFRPEAHFTAPAGWLNDPNGLFFLDGLWHIFYQHNPFSLDWGNMHWGHAVSRDLIHWRHLPLALYPDSLNDGRFGTMYSGSAFVDRGNVSGLGKDAVLLFYTKQHPGTSQGTQNLAYSTDGGKTFRKYSRNPLLPEFSSPGCCDRDPSVAYSPEDKCFYMAVYLGDEDRREFVLLASQNLLDWHETDRYSMLPGRECPGILRMQDEATHEWKWVLTEASGLCCIATISHGRITMESSPVPFIQGDAYAGQFFQNTPGGHPVYLGWIRMSSCPGRRFHGAMTSPLTMRLNGGRLLVTPFALCGNARPFRCGNRAVIHLPEGPLTFDMQTHTVTFGNSVWKIPQELPGLDGTIVTDKITLEYFDRTGAFALCLSALTGTETDTALQISQS